jgi:hypothetical protein
MQLYTIPTASNVAVFLNGFHVELAYGLQYKESIPKIPIYGYNDYEYSKTVRGKGMVQGMLVINFTNPAYLAAVLGRRSAAYSPRLYNYHIAEEGASADGQYKKTVESQLATEMPANTDKASKVARAEFISQLVSSKKNAYEYNKTKQAILAFFEGRKYKEVEENTIVQKTVVNPLILPSKNAGGNEMDIYYQDPELAYWFVRFTNVEFTEISQQISQAGAEGSSEPLYHICQFIARSVEIKQITTNH